MVLSCEVTELGLSSGDLRTVVLVHGDGKAFEVEFLTLAGEQIAVTTLRQNQIRPIGRDEIPHVRRLAAA